MTPTEEKLKLLAMFHSNRNGDSVTINWHEEGGGEVYWVNGFFIVFEAPQFGGFPRFAGAFEDDKVDEVMKLIHSWT